MENLQPFLFWVIAVLTAVCAIMVVATQNIVRSATWLLFTLAGVSGIFFLLGADLVGATQLLVYVGGTLVLVVFGVMLTAQGPFISMKTGAAEWAISTAVGLLLLGVLTASAFSVGKPRPPAQVTVGGKTSEPALHKFVPQHRLVEDIHRPGERAAQAPYSAVLGQGFSGVGVGPAHTEPARAEPIGSAKVIRTHYLLPFEIVSVHLLVVLIGAAYLARAKRKRRTA
jgi:NADH-quinone oxidoreductase subunit J